MVHIESVPVAEYEELHIVLPVMFQQQIHELVVMSRVLQADDPFLNAVEIGTETDMALPAQCAHMIDMQQNAIDGNRLYVAHERRNERDAHDAAGLYDGANLGIRQIP